MEIFPKPNRDSDSVKNSESDDINIMTSSGTDRSESVQDFQNFVPKFCRVQDFEILLSPDPSLGFLKLGF